MLGQRWTFMPGDYVKSNSNSYFSSQFDHDLIHNPHWLIFDLIRSLDMTQLWEGYFKELAAQTYF